MNTKHEELIEDIKKLLKEHDIKKFTADQIADRLHHIVQYGRDLLS